MEKQDRFAAGVFRQFLIQEEGDMVLIITPTEEYKEWVYAYIKTRLKDYPKKVVVKSAQQDQVKDNINPRYTFENFVVGPSNQLAYKVCLEVAENPGRSFSPLFLYGRVGLGKTHLLHAIGNRAKTKGYRAMYSSINDFSEEMVKALKEGKIEKFREKYINVDILLLDDVQFLAGKERTQMELFRVFEKLQTFEKQIVLVSDRHPKDLKDVPDRLVSRFESGLLLEIGLDDETRISVIKKKLMEYGFSPEDSVVSYVAENTGYNVREIEGFIRTMKVLGEVPKPVRRDQRSIETVVRYVAKNFKVDPELLRTDSKDRKVVSARQIAMYLCKTLLGSSYTEISRYFGKKDHTSALYAIKKVEEKRRTDRKFHHMLKFLEDGLRKHLS